MSARILVIDDEESIRFTFDGSFGLLLEKIAQEEAKRNARAERERAELARQRHAD